MRSQRVLAMLAAAGLVAGGCAAPTVTARHIVPAAVPLGRGVVGMETGKFVVGGTPDESLAGFVAETVGQRKPKFWIEARGEAVPTGPGQVLRVDGVVFVEVRDAPAARTVRAWDGQTRSLKPHELLSLVRKVNVRVDFVLRHVGDEQTLATVETRRSYDSSGDPRVRGELGLLRGDDPQRVPAAGQVARELLTECVDAFWGMVTPLELVEEIRLRPAPNAEGSAGLAAAGRGDLQGALRHFQAAAEADPKDANLMFNLAAAAEAAGDMQLAADGYRQAGQLASGRDAPAAEGARRVGRLLQQAGSSQ